MSSNDSKGGTSAYADRAASTPVSLSAPTCQAHRRAGWLRCVWRSGAFLAILGLAAADYARVSLFCRGIQPLRRRAVWLQRWSQITCQLLGINLCHRGVAPGSGMLVSNHLSYLDILVYSSLSGCVFVAKKEVAGWPVLGVFAKMAGTIFVDRTRRMDVAGANERIGEALRAGVVVVVFPEATSSSGEAVLPFHSSLLQPAALCRYPLTPAAITYQLDGGSVANEVCYWRDMTLLPHLLNLFTKPGVRARVAFAAAAPAPELCSRKAHASHLHDSVSALLTSLRA